MVVRRLPMPAIRAGLGAMPPFIMHIEKNTALLLPEKRLFLTLLKMNSPSTANKYITYETIPLQMNTQGYLQILLQYRQDIRISSDQDSLVIKAAG